jgi:hypothetical protein
MKKQVMILLLALLIIPMLYSYQESLGIVKQNEPANLIQTCYDSTEGYITRVVYPDKTFAINEQTAMTKIGDNFNYSFLNTSQLGQYLVYGYCDETIWQYDFEVTVNGKEKPSAWIIIFFSTIFVGIICFGIIHFLKCLSYVVEFKMDLIDTATMMFTYFAMWFFYYFSKEYFGNPLVEDFLELAISIGGITHVFLAIVGFLVSYILSTLKFKQKSRVTY